MSERRKPEREWGFLPRLVVHEDFDEPLTEEELADWYGPHTERE